MTAPDHRLLSSHERLLAVHRVEAAMAAASQEILGRPMRTQDEPLDSDMSDFDLVAAWLDHHHPDQIASVVVQCDFMGHLKRRNDDIDEGCVTGQERRPAPGDFRAVRVDTIGGAEDPALAEEAARALAALGWRQGSDATAGTWSMSWAPEKMSASFRAHAVERTGQALARLSVPASS